MDPEQMFSRATVFRVIKRSYAMLALAAMCCSGNVFAQNTPELPDVIRDVQPRMVKIFGAGGLRRLESWQSGFRVSDGGLVITVRSYVLDGDDTTGVMDKGQR